MAVGRALKEIGGMERIERVELHVAADLDIPVEPLLEDAVAQAVHLGEILCELAVTVGSDELHHDRLLRRLAFAYWRRDVRKKHPVQLHRVTADGPSVRSWPRCDRKRVV